MQTRCPRAVGGPATPPPAPSRAGPGRPLLAVCARRPGGGLSGERVVPCWLRPPPPPRPGPPKLTGAFSVGVRSSRVLSSHEWRSEISLAHRQVAFPALPASSRTLVSGLSVRHPAPLLRELLSRHCVPCFRLPGAVPLRLRTQERPPGHCVTPAFSPVGGGHSLLTCLDSHEDGMRQ